MKFREIERIIKDDGWYFDNATGGHYHYVHPVKQGKVTIPHHNTDIPLMVIGRILKQAGLR